MARSDVQLTVAAVVAAAQWLGTALPATAVEARQLRTVWISRAEDAAEQAAARLLQEGFQALYGFRPAVVAGPPNEGMPGVVLGRQLALASGKVTEAELEEVKFDGYVIKAAGNRIILTGYDRVGTRYAPAALLRRLGMRWVPWPGSISGVVEAVPKDPPSQIEPFVESSRPFYEYRDLLSQHRPDIFRTMYRDYRLNDPSKAAIDFCISNAI